MSRDTTTLGILDRFPKARPALSPKEASVHATLMKRNRERLTLFTRISDVLESWMHRQVSADVKLPRSHRLLEIGAGTLNHLPYEPADVIYDVVEPSADMYDDKAGRDRIHAFYANTADIDGTLRYDRIISIAALEHMTDLPDNIAKAGLLLNDGGLFRAGIPSEGGLIWGLSWRLIGLDLFMRTGHNWAEHMRNEHVNTASEIIAVVKYFFDRVTVRRFPLPFHHLSFYGAIDARQPNKDRCNEYLQRRTALTGEIS
jgi:hypothetical protein